MHALPAVAAARYHQRMNQGLPWRLAIKAGAPPFPPQNKSAHRSSRVCHEPLNSAVGGAGGAAMALRRLTAGAVRREAGGGGGRVAGAEALLAVALLVLLVAGRVDR